MADASKADFAAAMFLAARKGDAAAVLSAVRAVPALAHERDPDNGWTLLHVFARLSLASPVTALLECGADPEARDKAFRSALHMAALADAEPMLGGELPAAEVDRKKAAVATLRSLLKGGARTTARDSFGLTALHHAAHAGHADTVLFLLSLNTEMRLPRAPLEAETNAEERPLHMAASGGHAATVRLLLEQGAHPGKTNYLGQSALHLACQGGDTPAALATARELVKPEWKADLSSAANDGSTPLHVAAAGGHNKMVAVLMHARKVLRTGGGRGVLLDARDRRGRTPADVARFEGFDDVATALEAALGEAVRREEQAAAEKERALRQAFSGVRLDDQRPRATGSMASVREGAEEGEEPDALETMMEAADEGA